jgi:CRP/FNR family transcriptional regulator
MPDRPMPLTEQLAALPLFAGLEPAALRVLATRGIERRAATGEALFHAGDEAAGVYVVLEGRVRVVREVDGRRIVLHVEGGGGTLGEVPTFAGGPFPATAIAAEPTRCIVLTPEVIAAAIGASPRLALRLLERMALRVREMVTRLDRLAFQQVGARLARYLLVRAERSRSGTVISLGLTHRQLAEELGTVREVIVRELLALRRAGLIRAAGGGRIEIVDREGLRGRAG